jgi:tetratricopeptide (TPR) repeat protein
LSAALRLVFNACALLLALAGAVALGAVALQAQPLDWTHLTLGRLLAEGGEIPKAEALLYGLNAPFDASCWGWDWCAFQGLHAFGPLALRLAEAAGLALGVLATLGACFRRGARPFSSALFTLAAWALLRPDLHPGPGLLALPAFAAALWLMEGDFWPALFNRGLWLAPLALLTVNATPLAWALAPLTLAWLALEDGVESRPAQPRLAKALFGGVLLLCLCLHPQGPRPAWAALRALEGSPLLPEAFGPRQGALLLLALTAGLTLASSWVDGGRRHLGRDAATLAAFGVGALLSRSLLPFALLWAAPVAAGRLDALVDALPAGLRRLRWPIKTLGLLGLGVAAGLHGWAPQAPPPGGPSQTVGFYERELLDLRVLCPPAWAGLLAWKLAPNVTLALDGRGLGPPERRQALLDALDGRGDLQGVLDGAQVEACWLPLGSPLAVALTTAQAWQPVSFDDESVLYVRATKANADLIRVNAPRGLRPGDQARPVDGTRVAQAEADLEARLSQDPNEGVLYLYQAELWLAKGQEDKARQTLEAGIRADEGFAPDYARLADLRAARGDTAAARTLYRRALRLRDEPLWRQSLASLDGR